MVASKWRSIFLADRFNRFSEQSSWPTRTYVTALDMVNRTDEALQALEDGMQRRQRAAQDGDMLIFASEFYGRCGNKQREKELLESARGNCRKSDWLRAAVSYSINHGQLAHAEKLLKKVVEAEPFDLGSQQGLVQLLSDQHGPVAAEQYLQQTVDRFPAHLGLKRIQAELYSREDKYAEAESVLRGLLQLQDRDPWTLRELAVVLASQRRNEEALPLAEQAIAADPNSPESHHIHGAVANRMGQTALARASFQAALERSIDSPVSMHSLMRTCDTKKERQQTLSWIYRQFSQQHSTGEGLIAFHDVASTTMDADVLLKTMRTMLKSHQQLWQAWVAVVHRYLAMVRLDEAADTARQATERFPLYPQIWMELAQVYREQGESEQEIQTLKRGLAVNEAWTHGLRELGDAYLRADQLPQAEKCLLRACRLEPRDSLNLGILAGIRWQQEKRDDALRLAADALERNPGYEQAWSSIMGWSREAGRDEFPLQVVERLKTKHPYDVRPLLMQLELLGESGPADGVDPRLSVIESALKIDPRNTDVHYQHALTWASLGEKDKAVAACRPAVFGDNPPHSLRVGKAVVLARLGMLEEAIPEMQRALEGDPDDGFGWMQLADWHDAQGDKDGLFEAASNMMRINPNYEVALGYMGDALLRLERKEEAIEHLTHAVRVNPDYSFGAIQAFDLLLEEGGHEEAEKVIEQASFKSEPAWKQACLVRLYGVTRRVNLMQNALRELYQSKFEQGNPIHVATEYVVEKQNSLRENVLRIASEVFDDPATHPYTGSVWGRHKLQQLIDQFPRYTPAMLFDELQARDTQSACWPSAIAEVLDFFGMQKEPEELDRLVEKFSGPLWENTDNWSVVGQAYQHHRPKACVDWMADWQQRDGLRPHHLLPLILSHWDLLKLDSARPVAAACVEPGTRPCDRPAARAAGRGYGDRGPIRSSGAVAGPCRRGIAAALLWRAVPLDRRCVWRPGQQRSELRSGTGLAEPENPGAG